MVRRHLAICCLFAASLGLTACGDGSEAADEVPAATLNELVLELDRTAGERLLGDADDVMVTTPELIGVPLPKALARLERIKGNALRAFESGRLPRRIDFGVRTEVVPGFAGARDELVVSGYVVGTEPGAKLIADRAQVTLYAVPSSRFEQEPTRDSFRARVL